MTERWDVVLVDDDSDLTSVMSSVMREHGLKVWVAPDAEGAARAVRLLSPAVLVADLGLSGRGGDAHALLSRLRGAHGEPCVPFVLMSGSPDLRRHARRLGAAAVLRKPFGVTDLIAALRPFCPRFAEGSALPIAL